ncbi:hypothetical protein [Nonomuraea sp. NPDC049141]|uniref:hypothetical protein n=1 Tax=Nonomuraea sp. NPDC049141 TaxID=3155500 RepID=UPI0034091DE6
MLRVGGADTRSAEDLAATFVHEVNHARHQGGPDPLTMGREEFVNAAVQEEIDGEIRAHEFQVQLGTARGERYTGDSDYGYAYQTAIENENYRRHEQGRAELTAQEAQRVGDRAGRKALQEWARSAGYYIQTATERLDILVRQTFAAIHGHGAAETRELAPECDVAHADLLRVAPQAYASLLARLRDTAGGVRAHSATHKNAEHAANPLPPRRLAGAHGRVLDGLPHDILTPARARRGRHQPP